VWETRANDRDQALRRLRRATSVALAAAGALVVAFAGLAARALPGHHAVKSTGASAGTPLRRPTATATATPPPLVPAQSAGEPAAPASAPAPAQTQAPPVVVSGGT